MNETLRQEGDSRALAERRGQLNEKGIGPLFMTLLLLFRNFSQYTYSICSDVLFSLSDLVMAKTQAKVIYIQYAIYLYLYLYTYALHEGVLVYEMLKSSRYHIDRANSIVLLTLKGYHYSLFYPIRCLPVLYCPHAHVSTTI
jgi:hypothetical protein